MTTNTIGPYDPATTVGDVLRRAIARIGMGWCPGEWAMNRDGLPCVGVSELARKWGMIGSLASVPMEPIGGAMACILVVMDMANDDQVYRWESYRGRTKDDVLAVLRKALAIAEEQ